MRSRLWPRLPSRSCASLGTRAPSTRYPHPAVSLGWTQRTLMGELGTSEHTRLRLTLVRMGLVTTATGSWIMSSTACWAALSLAGR